MLLLNLLVSSCDKCQRTNQKMKKEHATIHPVAVKEEAWFQVGMDLVGPLPETPRINIATFRHTMHCFFAIVIV